MPGRDQLNSVQLSLRNGRIQQCCQIVHLGVAVFSNIVVQQNIHY